MTKHLVFAFVLAACGGGSSDPATNPDAAGPPDASAPALTCNSIALCTTYDINTFQGTVPPPAGGTIRSGLYRLGWKVVPDTVTGETGYHDELEAMLISGSSVHRAGFFHDDLGTLSTSGTMLSIAVSRNCDLGSDGSASTATVDLPYTATATQLQLYHHIQRSDGVAWDEIDVFVLASDPAEVCQTVTTTPATPGDSARCTVTNCACSFALGDTVQRCY